MSENGTDIELSPGSKAAIQRAEIFLADLKESSDRIKKIFEIDSDNDHS
ncbi:hypothetical protein HYT57_02115 [Candidatus Woesearchaeota archaeon]|nr:hypothetical protein [Candidatus Woesearchaeota archaeon]